MKLTEYQKAASETAIYPNAGRNLEYPTLGLCGEAGEIANKVKKIQRDNKGVLTEEARQAISKELGDVLWYVARIASELGFLLDDIALSNIDKLYSRKERGVLGGSGDER